MTQEPRPWLWLLIICRATSAQMYIPNSFSWSRRRAQRLCGTLAKTRERWQGAYFKHDDKMNMG